MASELERMLKEVLGDLKNFNPDMLRALVQEAVKTFTSLDEKSRSGDPEERGEALKTATALKDALQEQVEALSKMAGTTPRDLASLAEGSDMDPELLEGFKAATAELEALQGRPNLPKKAQFIGNKKKLVRIPG